jgi:ATP-dependent Clp protease ATP-binding subunit ClpC
METIMLSVNRFTQSAQDIALQTAAVMQRYGHQQIDTEELLMALLEQPQGAVPQLLEFLNVDIHALTDELDAVLRAAPLGDPVEVGPGQFAISPRLAHVLELADQQASQIPDELISTEHIFLAICREQDIPAARLLVGAGLSYERVYAAIQQMRG